MADLPDHIEVRPDRDGGNRFVEVWGWPSGSEEHVYLFTIEVEEGDALASKAREVVAAQKGGVAP